MFTEEEKRIILELIDIEKTEIEQSIDTVPELDRDAFNKHLSILESIRRKVE